MDQIDYSSQIMGFLEEFILTTGTRPLFVSFNRDTYEKVSLQCVDPLTNYLAGDSTDKAFSITMNIIHGLPIQISPSLKDGVIVFIGGDGFLNRCYQVFDSTALNSKVQLSPPTIKFRQIDLEEE